jgi:hypothetical protein
MCEKTAFRQFKSTAIGAVLEASPKQSESKLEAQSKAARVRVLQIQW